MKMVKTLSGILLVAATLSFSSCGQSDGQNETDNSYQDTVESPTTNDNNMRNDQPIDELTTKDSLQTDSI
ncbi:hypothetical protein [Olivibacter sp. XZL3]|uniref:hypothetical protein n=1 Tax=Olivibacter sp. XZL3 TaxID=1735116 RepID=UPI001065032A|nr:hypothetical protein [Olivibacter sp. XZL3]